jgi:hypothetical protein
MKASSLHTRDGLNCYFIVTVTTVTVATKEQLQITVTKYRLEITGLYVTSVTVYN